jgi:hypothetical protein
VTDHARANSTTGDESFRNVYTRAREA